MSSSLGMHIGFDISQTGSGKAGCGYYADAMTRAVLEVAPAHRFSLFPSFGDFYFDPMMPLFNTYTGTEVHYGPRHLTRESAGAFWTSTDVEKSIGNPDIIHSNNFWCPTQFGGSRLVYTFYDMGFIVNPAWTTEANRLGCFQGVFRSAAYADWVVAISEFSRAHYLRTFPHFSEERIRVIHPCSRFTDSALEGKKPRSLDSVTPGAFWLNVGTIEPRKNQYRLIDAYARYLALGGSPMPLILAGGKGWLMDRFTQHIEQLGIKDRVIMTGYVSDEELIWLYRNCYANLYPSLFEGFGLPVLEGMQFGAPSLASNSTSIPEIAGDAAVLLQPEDTESWAQAMVGLSVNREDRERLSVMARKRAAQFDWKRSGASLLSLYEEAAASPKRMAPV